MQLGIFAKTFVRPTLEAVLDAVVSHGLSCVQFNFACAGLPSLPETIETRVIEHIRSELVARKISVAAASGTFNMIHPDPHARQDGLRRLPLLAKACQQIGRAHV